MTLPTLKYNADGLIPAIVQDAKSKRVLMMAWMNAASLEATLRTGFMNYWSRSRHKQYPKTKAVEQAEHREERERRL